jgi:hypothetical protein
MFVKLFLLLLHFLQLPQLLLHFMLLLLPHLQL